MLRYCIAIMLLLSVHPLAARMYQWIDPASGRTHLSGTPPTWYRSGGEHPRVFVFEKGRLVDDTGMAVSESERMRLRQEAMARAEENAAKARQAAEQSALLRSRIDSKPPKPVAIPKPETVTPPAAEDEENTAAQRPTSADTQGLTEEQIEELRSLISEWESRKQERARALLESEAQSDVETMSRQSLRQYLEQNPRP